MTRRVKRKIRPILIGCNSPEKCLSFFIAPRPKEEIEKKMEEMKAEINQSRQKVSKLVAEKENLKQLTTTMQKELYTILHPEHKRYEDMAVLFLDLKGFSKMENEEQKKAEKMLWTLAAGIAVEYEPQFRKTWGDAIFCAFADVNHSLLFACKLIQTLQISNKTSRIGLSYGQLEVVFDTFSSKLDIVDEELSKAARLEPLAKANEVLVTEELHARRDIDHSKFEFMLEHRMIEKPFSTYKKGDMLKCYRVELK